MIDKKINKLRNLIKLNNIDGYIVPKNDEFFSEYAFPNRLKTISNFSGSAGLAIILKEKNLETDSYVSPVSHAGNHIIDKK